MGTATRGFPALEVLLWADGEGTLAAFQADPRRCPYALGLATDIDVMASRMVDAWASDWSDRLVHPEDHPDDAYDTLQDVIDEWVNRMAFTVEDIRSTKLGKPVGDSSGGEPLPDTIEFRYSGRSLQDARDALSGVRDVGEDGISISSPRTGRTSSRRSPSGRATPRRTSRRSSSRWRSRLSRTGWRWVAQDALLDLQVLLQVDLAQALSVTLAFNDNDGDELRAHLGANVDGAGLVAFRVFMGLLWVVAAVRFVAWGWVDELLLRPVWHFAWVDFAVVPPAPVTYGLFAVQVLAGLCVAAGVLYRPAVAAFLLAFGYVELLDVTLYLNHYVLVTILAATMLVCRLHRTSREPQPAWGLWLLRIEVGLVYVWAGICKLNGDWLLRGEPLHTWLRGRTDLPVVGPWLAMPETAFVMSWGGAAYDLLIPVLLLAARTRPVAYLLVVGFHLVTWWLFPIGISRG